MIDSIINSLYAPDRRLEWMYDTDWVLRIALVVTTIIVVYSIGTLLAQLIYKSIHDKYNPNYTINWLDLSPRQHADTDDFIFGVVAWGVSVISIGAGIMLAPKILLLMITAVFTVYTIVKIPTWIYKWTHPTKKEYDSGGCEISRAKYLYLKRLLPEEDDTCNT